jgi:hypothetical protein
MTMQKLKYTGLGTAAGLANVMAAGTVANTLTATGTSSQANSYAITDDVSVFTSAGSNSGARLPSTSSPGDILFIANMDSNTMLVYPPTSGYINSGSQNASVSLTTKTIGMFISVNGSYFIYK